jgi:hypothetical protein
MARTTKLAMLPNASPATSAKPATVAATSTSSFLPCKRGLCSSDGADIIHKLDTYPLDIPNANRMSMTNMSELMIGDLGIAESGRWMLHSKNKGMNNVLASERESSLREDQMRIRGNEQR